MALIVDFLRDTVYREKFEVDLREPEVFFRISCVNDFPPSPLSFGPGSPDDNRGGVEGDGLGNVTLGLIGFDPTFWFQLCSIVILFSVMNILVAAVVYNFIVQKRRSGEGASSMTSAYVLGYMVICPLLTLVPLHTANALDIRNVSLVFACCAGPIMLFFHCIESMHGTEPRYVRSGGFRPFVTYYAASVHFDFGEDEMKKNNKEKKKKNDADSRGGADKIDEIGNAGEANGVVHGNGTTLGRSTSYEGPKPFTRREFFERSALFISLFLQTSLLLSLVKPFDYRVFHERDVTYDPPGPVLLYFLEMLRRWLSPGHMANNYIMGYLTGLCLETGSIGLGLATSLLTGICTVRLNHDPLTKSSTPSDFWGNRWNTLVSSALKRAVFLPMRIHAGSSRPAAAVATFFASGALHEYILYVLLAKTSVDGRGIVGTHMAFFLWNGVVMMLEHLWKNCDFSKRWDDRFYSSPIARWLLPNKTMPPAVRTALVVLTVLPLSHLFTDAYVKVGFYDQFALGFPLVVRV